MPRSLLPILLAVPLSLLFKAESAVAGPVHWADFGSGSFPAGTVHTLNLSPGSTVDVLVETGGTRGVNGGTFDTLGRASTGLDYSVLRLLGIFNGGGFSSVTTRLTFRNFQLGALHQRGLFLIGAVNGLSSPIQLSTTLPGGTSVWTVVGETFPFGADNSFPISWNAASGQLETSALSGNDSRCIVIDVGDLNAQDSIRVTLQQHLNDGIVFGFGEELIASASVPESAADGVAFAPPWPNPARTTTTLKFAMTTSGRASVAAFDLEGRRIATIADGELAAGDHTLTWDLRDAGGRRVPPGLVFLRVAIPAGTSVRRLLIAR